MWSFPKIFQAAYFFIILFSIFIESTLVKFEWSLSLHEVWVSANLKIEGGEASEKTLFCVFESKRPKMGLKRSSSNFMKN